MVCWQAVVEEEEEVRRFCFFLMQLKKVLYEKQAFVNTYCCFLSLESRGMFVWLPTVAQQLWCSVPGARYKKSLRFAPVQIKLRACMFTFSRVKPYISCYFNCLFHCLFHSMDTVRSASDFGEHWQSQVASF